jgi:hypothetical protein
MNNRFSRTGRLIASAAALSLVATPVMARGWGGGWGRHHNDIDAGDVITGILIIGGIAAIASAASKGSKDRQRNERERDRDYPERDYPQRDSRDRDDSRGYGNDDRPSWQEGRGIDSAVNRCVGEVERGDKRVDQVETVNRDGQGWKVTGRMTGGDSFSCTIDGEGRVRSSDIGGQTAWSEEEEALPAS